MAIFVGIDEAGFGPILGPLVVSSSTFRLGRELLEADLWQVLKKSIGRRRSHLAGRLLVTDSKKAYSKSVGIKHLERTVLGFLRHLGGEPKTAAELIGQLCPDCLERLASYPWYKDTAAMPLQADSADRAIASAVLGDDLAANGIELLQIASRCLDVAHYNRMVAAVRNKANVLFTATCALIDRALQDFGEDDLNVVVDRQGGRIRYRKVLQRMFEPADLAILREGPALSSYELTVAGRRMRVHFAVGADRRFLPVSLASMASKYLREVLMACINRYFTAYDATLEPTAGYWKDGRRFIEALKANMPDLSIDENQLIRCR